MEKSNLVMVLFLVLLVGEVSTVVGFDSNRPHATFYGGADVSGTNNGACGYGNTFAFGYGTMTTALSAPLFNNGLTCGACFQLWCEGSDSCYPNPITVTATNLCPQGSFSGVCDWPQQHFDLSQPAFSRIAPLPIGVVNVRYQRVTCQTTGGIRFYIQGHTYFFQMLVFNVAGSGDVNSVSVKGSNTGWIYLNHGWGQNFNTRVVLDGQPLSFQVTTGDGRSVTSWNVANQGWQYGQTFDGSQF